MPTSYPAYTGVTAQITPFASNADVRTFNYDSYNWTPVQTLINRGIHIDDLPEYVGTGKYFTKTILRRALYLNKIARKQNLSGRDF